jgi:hypothetical protein
MLVNKDNFFEALDVVILTLITLVIFLDLPLNIIFVMINIAIMNFVGISGSKPKKYRDIIFSCVIVSCSAILGNYFNQYHTAAFILFIIYAGLSCYLPKFKGIFNPVALNAGALMFVIYAAMPFQLENTKYYIIGSCVILVLFLVYYLVRNNFYKSVEEEAQKVELESIACYHIAVIVVISLIVGYFLNRMIACYYPLSHSYWIALSILVIIQNTYRKTVIICIKRIIVNFVGAVIAVICFLYIFPNSVYFNFIFLIVIMFFIFLFGSSYTLRVIFIEIFIFGLALFTNHFFISTGVERVVDTIIGGVIVLVITTGYVYILNILKEKKLS